MLILALGLSLCFLLAVHPYTTYPASLVVLRRLRGVRPLRRGKSPESYAIVCCVFNEEQVIEDKIANMLALRARLPNCEILIHSDGSTDGTDAILRRHAGEISLSFAEKRSGKSVGMNTLMRRITADIVIFTDANVMIDPERVGNVARYFQDPEVGCVTGHLSYTNANESQTASVGARYWRFEEWLKQLESDTGSVVGADGSIFAIRRSLYTPAPPDIIDDFHTSMSIYCSNHRIVRAGDLLAFERAATVRQHEIRRKVRISCRAFNCHRLLWSRIVQSGPLPLYNYVSHKLLRWLSGYFLAAGAILVALMALLVFDPATVVLVLGGVGLGLVLAGRTRLPVLGTIGEGIVAIAATGIGVYKSMRGARFQTWSVASSTRK